MTKKFLITSDLHIGNNKDSVVFHKIVIDYAYWIKTQMILHGANELIIAGDFFHNRTYITLPTLDTGHKFLDILQDFPINILVGNHDAWFLDNSDVHSLAPFKTRKNVHIYDKLTTVGDITYCPWGTTVEEIPDDSNILIGHWNLVSFQMAKGKICDHGIKGADLMEKCNMAFSGHFHKPQLRQYSGKPLRMLGSAFQLNWGESGEKKYCYILDSEKKDVNEIENSISPRFEYIRSEDDEDKILGNFISFQIVNDAAGLQLKEKYETMNPLVSIPNYIEKTNIAIGEKLEEFQLFQMQEATEEYVFNMTYDDNVKKEIIEQIMTIHNSFS